MYIFKNAMKNLLKNKGRNVIISLILLVTMTAVATCAILQQSAKRQVEEFTSSFLPKITLTMDYEKLSKDCPGRQVTNIDGTTYYKDAAMSADVFPSDDLFEKWRESSAVDHVDWTHVAYYCTNLKTIKNVSLVGGDSEEEYYGKDIEFFWNMAESEYVSQVNYYLSEEFKSSNLYTKLFSDNYDLTEGEAKELAARTVFGDEDYKEYLENGMSDKLAGVAFDMKMGYEGVMDTCLEMKQPTQGFVYAYASYDSPDTHFEQGIQTLESGTYPTKQNECLVSKQFAEENNLSVGDEIEITSGYKADGNATLNLNIVGIYSCYVYETTYQEGMESFLNCIYTTEDTLCSSGFTNYSESDPTYYLIGADVVDDFKKMMVTDGLGEYMNATDNVSELDSLIQPVEKISQFSSILLVIILILGGAVFLLLTFLAICERKYEIGVLRSIGMKKAKVIRGFLYETAAIVLLCSIVGMAVGTMISQPIANTLVKENVNGSQTVSDSNDIQIVDGSNVSGGQIEFGGGTITEASDVEEAVISNMSTSLSSVVILKIVVVALLLMSVAVIVAGLYITKFEPINILSNQE